MNPDHLEPVTGAENLRRKKSVPGHIAKQNRTHCKYGHEFTPENTMIMRTLNQSRRCKKCITRKNAEQYAKRKAMKLNVALTV